MPSKTPDLAALRPGEPVTGARRTELAAWLRARYEKGENVRALAAGIDRSYGFAHCLLVESKAVMRGRGRTARVTSCKAAGVTGTPPRAVDPGPPRQTGDRAS